MPNSQESVNTEVSKLFDYAEQHGLALFPLPYGSKEPFGIVASFAKDWSRDPAQWRAWHDEHNCNFGVVAGPSRLALADIDIAEVGEAEAWAQYCNVFTSRGVAVPQPQFKSARGGFHAAFAIPADVDMARMRQVPLVGAIEGVSKKPIVDMRIGNGYVVAAGSYYDGAAEGKASGHYEMLNDLPPHTDPAAIAVIMELCGRARSGSKSVAAGKADPNQAALVLKWMAANGGFDSYERWFKVGMILRAEFGDDPGLALWQLTNDGNVSREAEEAKWQSFSPIATADSVKIGTLRKWMSEDKCPLPLQNTIAAMFPNLDGVVFTESPHLAPDEEDYYDDESGGTPPPSASQIVAKPFVFRDPTTLPRMPWLYGYHLLRGCCSLTVAPTGVGKTFEKVGAALAMTTGRTLLHEKPVGMLRVWYINGEEPEDILERRFAAARLVHNLPQDATGDRLFVNDRLMKCVIARQTRDGVEIMLPVRDALIAQIRANRIDVVIIDPFIGAHAVSENDNNAIDQVVKEYADIAQITNCAIDLVHHSRKTNGESVTIEDSRGASSAASAVRAAKVLNQMSPEEAIKAGVENRFRYVRVDDGKPNHAPRAERAVWLQFESVHLHNDQTGIGPGDSIGALKTWFWPDAMSGVSQDDVEAVRKAVGEGEWRKDIRADNWVGHAVADALELDVTEPTDKAKVKGLISRWLKDGTLIEVSVKDEHRKAKKFIQCGLAQKPPPPA
jgi:hypothetical protein